MMTTVYRYDERHTVRVMERVSQSVWAVRTLPLSRDGAGHFVTPAIRSRMAITRIEVVDPDGNAVWEQSVDAHEGDTISIPPGIEGYPP